jgi:hypothetical protein
VDVRVKSIHEIAGKTKQLIARQYVWRLVLSDRLDIGNGRVEDPVNIGPVIAPKKIFVETLLIRAEDVSRGVEYAPRFANCDHAVAKRSTLDNAFGFRAGCNGDLRYHSRDTCDNAWVAVREELATDKGVATLKETYKLVSK